MEGFDIGSARARSTAAMLSVYTTRGSERRAACSASRCARSSAGCARPTTSWSRRCARCAWTAARRRLLVATDGEVHAMDTPLEFRIRPRALRGARCREDARAPLGPALRPRRPGACSRPLRRRVKALAPDLVVVSGDLTQRARARQFRAARAFLDSAAASRRWWCPGNHDVPLYNVLARFLRAARRLPPRRSRADVEPGFVDDEIAVLGINTARSFVFKGGRVSGPAARAGRRGARPARRASVPASWSPTIPPRRWKGSPTAASTSSSQDTTMPLARRSAASGACRC